jgi:hypothetical protein
MSPSVHSLPSTSLKEVTTTWAPLSTIINQNGSFVIVCITTLSPIHRFSTIHSTLKPASTYSFESYIKSHTFEVFLAFNHVKVHHGTCYLFTHSLLGPPSM